MVLLIGVLVARSTVNEVLSLHPDRWAFAGTWQLILAHTFLPVALFWFLDYVSVIQDTSLFAALLVAVGYQQLLAGGVQGTIQGISIPEQVASLWKPFQAWMKKISERIATKQKQNEDHFNQIVERDIAGDENLLSRLQALATAHSTKPAELADKLQAVPENATFEKVHILRLAVRQSEPEDYGYLLYRDRLISCWRYWWWLRKGKARIVSLGMLMLTAAVLGTVWWQFLSPSNVTMSTLYKGWSPDTQTGSSTGLALPYYQWRLRKANASPRDRFRSEEYVQSMWRESSEQGKAELIGYLMIPVLRVLCFKDEPTERVDATLRLLMVIHSPTTAPEFVPVLIECLRTENSDNRLRIQRTLRDLDRSY